ncbi:Toprim-like [Ruminococcus sp. YE71]|uniref:DUF3991 and TOPRIM domain-containing protein n=1 Tax=unclassified Ruminococcus TaxID=2608920 RepID=UPI0008892494|nr:MULTISPECIES: DUF3991 and TOPRIM domain-containing protein [unclassified Ruminococcus]SDA31074.1 Toprim-like [Ruminococcus sp. YE78]SFW50995.1 Toprim-like [Ruminococcus sp. YE71]
MPRWRTKWDGNVYIQYLPEEVEQVKQTSMIDFLNSEYGFTFENKGSAYICKEHDSLVVMPDQRSWYWNSRKSHGRNVIDWLENIEGYDYQSSLQKLIGTPDEPPRQSGYKKAPQLDGIRPAPETKDFVLPPKAEGQMKRVFAYLINERKLDPFVVSELVKEKMIYEEAKYHNCVFVGYDESGTARFAESKITNTYIAALKNENGKKKFHPINIAGSDKAYSFNVSADRERYPAGNNVLYIFEAPVDLMSHMTFSLMTEKRKAESENRMPDNRCIRSVNRLSLSGKSDKALSAYLSRNSNITMLMFALDNDDAGNGESEMLMEKYRELGYVCKRIKPRFGKDYNECLQIVKCKTEVQNSRPQITTRTENAIPIMPNSGYGRR